MSAEHKQATHYHVVLKQRYRHSWILATLVAALANAVLFLLMPALIAPTQVTPTPRTELNNINVIRLKRPEPPAQKRQPPPEEQQQQPPQELAATPQTLQIKTPPLRMPFAIDSRLPALSTDLKLPPAAVGPLNLAGSIAAVEMEQLDAPLTPLTRIPPVYPRTAQRRGIEGWVKVRFLVTEEGRVTKIEILDAAPADIFNSSVRRCLAGWRFRPGTVEGVAVSTWMQTTFEFELDK